MKYNLDCIREVLLFLEERLTITKTECEDGLWMFERSEVWVQTICNSLETAFDAADVVYSVDKLYEAGYIIISRTNEAKEFPALYCVTEITYKGHEFLENIRESENWKKTKRAGKAVGSFALSLVGEIAKNVALGAAQAFLSQNGLPM